MATLRYRYHTYEFGKHDVHVRTLRDKQQFNDDDGAAEAVGISSAAWPIFGVVWDGGHALARFMADFDVTGLRVLEVGCGIGLTSLLLNERRPSVACSFGNSDMHS